MKTPILLSAQCVLSALAQSLPQSGPNSPGIGSTPEALQISEAAGRSPNATNSVAFTRSFDSVDEAWSWRVNVTEIPTPNNLNQFGESEANFSENLRVTNTQWQLIWPGDDESLQSYLAKREMSYTFQTYISNKPANITNLYDSTKKDGDCGAILGSTCLNNLKAAARSTSGFRFTGVSGCEGTLDVSESGTGTAGIGFGWDLRKSNFSDSGSPAMLRNETFFYLTSKWYVAGDITGFNQAKSALHILAMIPKYAGARGGGGASELDFLCQIVDKSVVSSAASSASGYGSVVGLWGIVMLSALALW